MTHRYPFAHTQSCANPPADFSNHLKTPCQHPCCTPSLVCRSVHISALITSTTSFFSLLPIASKHYPLCSRPVSHSSHTDQIPVLALLQPLSYAHVTSHQHQLLTSSSLMTVFVCTQENSFISLGYRYLVSPRPWPIYTI